MRLLAASNPGATITIDHSEFNNNGTGTGLTHSLYVNEVGTLTITNSYFHDVNAGHEIKSRADTTIILNNRIANEPALSASYSIDLPNGGNATVSGNVIEKGLLAQNWTFVSFGEEGPLRDVNTLTLSGNTIINDMASGTPTLVRNPTSADVSVTGNTVYGVTAEQVSIGPVNGERQCLSGLAGAGDRHLAPVQHARAGVAGAADARRGDRRILAARAFQARGKSMTILWHR
jgi:hypothetical protein